MNYAPDLATAWLKMIFSLALVLAIVWGLYRLAKKKMPMAHAGGNGRLIQVVESQYLGLKKSVTMVKVPGSVLVLGVSADKVTLLDRIDDPGVLKGMDAYEGKNRSLPSFKAQLRRLTKGMNTKASAPHRESVADDAH